MMKSRFENQKSRSILERVVFAPFPFYCSSKFTIPEKRGKNAAKTKTIPKLEKDGENRDEVNARRNERRRGRKVVQTAPVFNAILLSRRNVI